MLKNPHLAPQELINSIESGNRRTRILFRVQIYLLSACGVFLVLALLTSLMGDRPSMAINFGFLGGIFGFSTFLTGRVGLWQSSKVKKSLSLLSDLQTHAGSTKETVSPSKETSPMKEALLRQIAEKSKEDPLVGAKLFSKEILQRAIDTLKSDRGLHSESLISAIGSVAGYSCQESVRAAMALNQQDPDAAFLKVAGADGKNYFFGDPINQHLIENKISIWTLAAAAAQDSGSKELLDIQELVSYVSSTVGSKEFGTSRIGEDHRTSHEPAEYVKAMWKPLLEPMKEFCPNPQLWPIACGLALQQAIVLCKDALHPDVALSIAMESAVPMSKVDIDSL